MVNAFSSVEGNWIAQNILYTMLGLPTCGIICDDKCTMEDQDEISIPVFPIGIALSDT